MVTEPREHLDVPREPVTVSAVQDGMSEGVHQFLQELTLLRLVDVVPNHLQFLSDYPRSHGIARRQRAFWLHGGRVDRDKLGLQTAVER